MTNDEIIARVGKMESILKATTSVSDGIMNPEEAKKFIRETVDQSEFLKMIDVLQMNSPKRKIHTIGLESRVLRKAIKDVPPAVTELELGERELDVKETILAVNIHFDEIEDNIEESNFEETVNDIFTTQYSTDLADLAMNGDETSLDPFLQINNGYLEIADTDTGVHAVPFAANDTPREVFKAMFAALPNKWKANKGRLAFLVSPTLQENYTEEIGNRISLLGDKAILDEWQPTYNGVPIKAVAHMPDTNVMLTDPKNLKFGWFKRYIRVGRWVNERSRRIEYTITARTDQEYALSDLMVIATQI